MTCCGVLLIGGASRRMGQPKHLLAHEKDLLGVHLYKLLCQCCSEVAISGPGQWPAEIEALHLKDRQEGAGPLAGILAGFDKFPQKDLLVLATDMVAMGEDALLWLLAQVDLAGEAAVVWPRFEHRPFGEPLAAIYRSQARTQLERAWSQGIRSLKHSLPTSQRWEPTIPKRFARAFRNANTPQQYRELLSPE